MSLYNSTHLEKPFPDENSVSSWLNGVKGLQPDPTSAGEQQQNTASGFRTTVECFPEGMLSCTFGHFEKSLVSESECELKLLASFVC